jgi:lysophospholipase L1-like esterase
MPGWLSRVLLLVLTFTVAAMIGEAAIRLLEANDLMPDEALLFPVVPHQGKIRPIQSPGLYWELDPAGGGLNSHGFRNREVSLEKAQGVTRIAVLGDSVTFGYGLPVNESFPAVLERELNRTGTRYEVLNFGVVGYNAQQEAALYARRVRPFAPDIVVVAYVLNDGIPASEMLAFFAGSDAEREAETGTSRSRLIARAQRAFVRLRGIPPHDLVPWLTETHTDRRAWGHVERALRSISAVAKRDGAEPILAILPLLLDLGNQPFAEETEQVARVGRREGFEVIDLHEKLRDQQEVELRLTPGDVIHPNARGHRLIAEALAEALGGRDPRSLQN